MNAQAGANAGATRAFTDEQLAAIDRRDGDLLISASAGSGKTSVLVERFVRSVLDDGLAVSEILAITFTDKAAGELRARVRAALLDAGAADAARELEGAWVMTFHALCARLLRGHAVSCGLDPAFAVLEPAEARAARAEAFDTALAAFLAQDGDAAASASGADALDLVAAYGVDRLRTAILDVHEQLRSAGQTRPALPRPRRAASASATAERVAAACDAVAAELAPARSIASIDRARDVVARCTQLVHADALDARAVASLRLGREVSELKTAACDELREALQAHGQARADADAAPVAVLLDELLGGFADAYAAAKRARGGVDYDDLQLLVRDLLRDDAGLAARHGERFARIMVDEFQDTNPLQLELLQALARGNLCTVGDELQSIYGFRHADVELFRARRDELEGGGATATLATSFRARPPLLATIDAAFAGEHPRWTPLIAGRREPARGDTRDAPPVELLIVDADACSGELPADVGAGLPAAAPVKHVEARAVARRVAALVRDEGFAAGDVVVLLRASAEMGLYERALELEGLPTLASGGRGWWSRQQVLDLCCYLAALVNPRDEEALLGVLASPLVGVGADGLALLAMARGGRSLWDAAQDPEVRLPERDAAALARFRSWFAVERQRAPSCGLDELLTRVVRIADYDLHVLSLPDGARRLANLHKLLRLAAAFEGRRGRDARAFVDVASAELEAGAPEPDAPIDLGGQDAVRLMTVHAAKGLEFGVVVLADLGRRPTLRQGDVLVDGDRLGLRLVGLDGTTSKALDYAEIEAHRRASDEAEERRIMHVAVTRAQELLVLSGAAALGERWPAPGASAPPLSWIGPALVGQIAELTPARPTIEQRWVASGAWARATLVSTSGPVGDDPQLQLFAAQPAAPPADDRGAPADMQPARSRPAEVPSRAPAPARPRSLSYSALARYAQCPYRFHLERDLRLAPTQAPPSLLPSRARTEPMAGPMPVATGLDLLLRGTLAHALLERWDPRSPLPDTAAVRAVGEAHDVELADADVEDLLGLVGAYAASPPSERVRRAATVWHEHRFAFVLDEGGPIVNGVLDVLAIEDDGAALVVDFKSDHIGDAEPEALIAGAYGVQRQMYALAALRGGAPAVDVAHLFLERPAEPAIARYAAADADALACDLRRQATSLLVGEFPVAEVPHRGLCATCPGRGGLCSHPLELTDRELADR